MLNAIEIENALSIADPIDRDQAVRKLIANSGTVQDIDQLASLAERIEGEYEKAEAYIDLTEKSPTAERASEFLRLAEASAKECPERFQTVELMGKIASVFADAGDNAQAIEYWNISVAIAQDCQSLEPDGQEAYDCGSALGDIVDELSRRGHLEAAKETAESIRVDSIRERVIKRLETNS